MGDHRVISFCQHQYKNARSRARFWKGVGNYSLRLRAVRDALYFRQKIRQAKLG